MSGAALRISDGLVCRIQAHGVETYPHECCGALLGNDSETAREVVELLPLANRRNDSPRNRFEVTSDDVQMAEKKAKEDKKKAVRPCFLGLAVRVTITHFRSVWATGSRQAVGFSQRFPAQEVDVTHPSRQHLPEIAR